VKKGIILIAASVLLIASSFAYGEGYIGVSAGQSDYGDDGFGFDKGTSLGILAGYKLNEYIAIEGGYTDLGDAEDDIAPIWTASGSTINLSAIAIFPIAEIIDIYAKAGAYYWDAKVSEAGYGKLVDDTGTDLGYGVGINVNFTDSVGLFIEYLGLNVDGDDASNISAGIKVRFGGSSSSNKKSTGRRLVPGSTYESSQQSVNQNAGSETPSYINELEALATLRDDRIITEVEFQKQKAKILNRR